MKAHEITARAPDGVMTSVALAAATTTMHASIRGTRRRGRRTAMRSTTRATSQGESACRMRSG